jgi:hypothetical protein
LDRFNVSQVRVRKEGQKYGLMDGWMDGRNVKVKITLGQATITQRRSRDIALLFL